VMWGEVVETVDNNGALKEVFSRQISTFKLLVLKLQNFKNLLHLLDFNI